MTAPSWDLRSIELAMASAFAAGAIATVWLRSRRWLRELNEEAALGIIPGEHVRPLALPFLGRRLSGVWSRAAERRAYVRLARHLATRKASMRSMSASRRQVAMIEVLRLRERLRGLQPVELPIDGVVRSARTIRKGDRS